MNKTIVACVLAALTLQGCVKPDRNSPHEYIRIDVLSKNGAGVSHRDISAVSTLIKWDSNVFVSGSGECQERLSKLTDNRIKSTLRGWNFAVRQGHLEDMPLALGFQLQCIESFGRDEQCVEEINKIAKFITDPTQLIDFLFKFIPSCNRSRQIGEPRVVLAI